VFYDLPETISLKIADLGEGHQVSLTWDEERTCSHGAPLPSFVLLSCESPSLTANEPLTGAARHPVQRRVGGDGS
jgi:hypothetical protein